MKFNNFCHSFLASSLSLLAASLPSPSGTTITSTSINTNSTNGEFEAACDDGYRQLSALSYHKPLALIRTVSKHFDGSVDASNFRSVRIYIFVDGGSDFKAITTPDLGRTWSIPRFLELEHPDRYGPTTLSGRRVTLAGVNFRARQFNYLGPDRESRFMSPNLPTILPFELYYLLDKKLYGPREDTVFVNAKTGAVTTGAQMYASNGMNQSSVASA